MKLSLVFLVTLVAAVAAEPKKSVDVEFVLENDGAPEGSFKVTVHPDWAPLGAARFLELVDAKYYDGNKIFRVIPGFVAQFGLNGNPAVTKNWQKKIDDDPKVDGVSNIQGYVTFATSGAKTRTTQIFINLGDNVELDKMGFTPFGYITDGFDSTNKIRASPDGDYQGTPPPDQGEITNRGDAYLNTIQRKLTTIKSARVVPSAKTSPVGVAP